MDTIKINSKKTKMVAHRGVSWLEKENTCPAFVAAANRTYFGIETDIHVTKDGKFVVIHDETTKRITNDAVEINVEENDYDAVKDILLPDFGASLPRSDIRIPLLADYIAICKKYDKTCVLEIKNPFKEEDLVRMIEEIKTLDYLDKMIFISFAFALPCTFTTNPFNPKSGAPPYSVASNFFKVFFNAGNASAAPILLFRLDIRPSLITPTMVLDKPSDNFKITFPTNASHTITSA